MTYYLKAGDTWILPKEQNQPITNYPENKPRNFEFSDSLEIFPNIICSKFVGKIELSRIIYEDHNTASIDYSILQEFHKKYTIKPLDFYPGNSEIPPQILTDFCPINLHTYLESQSDNNKEDLTNIIHEIILIMKFAHSNKIFHRNLNLRTVVLDEQHHVKLFGFKQSDSFRFIKERSKNIQQFLTILSEINQFKLKTNQKIFTLFKQSQSFDEILSIFEENKFQIFEKYTPFVLNQIDNFKQVSISIHRLTNPFYIELMDDLHINRVHKGEDADICWFDGFLRPEQMGTIPPNQILNKIPCIQDYCGKTKFFQCLNDIIRKKPEYQAMYSETFLFDPYSRKEFVEELENYFEGHTWIAKKDSSWGGHSVELFQDINFLETYEYSAAIQKYLRPFLIDKHKFDMRIFVLVTELEPFTFYIYDEGLAKFSTQEYEEPNEDNLHNPFIHLTNICVNRENPDHNKFRYMRLASEVIKEVEVQLKRKGKTPNLWKEIGRCASLAMTALKPYMINYTKEFGRCTHHIFHLFGLDIIIDHNGQPRILEINANPSLKIEYPIKIHFKNVLFDELCLVISQKINRDIPSQNNFHWIKSELLPC